MPISERLTHSLAERYRIERELGQGGMATVYLAQDLKHDRRVALKVLKPELAAVLGAERFVQEIKTTAALQHPHILPLFDSGAAEGFLYYVMPFIDGETLRTRLDRETQLGIDDAVRLTTAIADALDYAHRHGVIHRDIKPENILLHDGRPMVADFGIALALSAAAGGRMTETGMSLGTPHYMSPEQATADKELTGRSDIYSLASVLYEMLTGDPPHTGSSAQQIIMKIVTEEAQPVTKLRRAVPPNVAAAVSKALEKLPADRFATAHDFAEALGNPSFGLATATAPMAAIAARGRSRSAVYGVAGAFVALAALGAWGWVRRAPVPGPTRERIALTTKPLAGGDIGRGMAMSPDGSTIVFSSDGTGKGQLWIKSADPADPEPLAGTDGALSAAFSPDGQWIAFVAGGKVRKVPRAGGSSVAVADSAAPVGSVPSSIAWLDNGTIAYTDQQFGLAVVGQDGGPVRRFNFLATVGAGVASIGALRGGHAVLLGMCNWGCPSSGLYVADLKTGRLDSIAAGGVRGWQLADGRVAFATVDGGVFVGRFDAGRRRFTSAPVSVLNGVRTVMYWPDLALAPDGTLLYVPGAAGGGTTRSEALWVTRDGRATPVDSGWAFTPSSNAGMRLSPDGRRLAISVISGGREEVWIKQLDHGPFVRLTIEGSAVRPEWSADGRSVFYFGVRSANNSDLRRRRADGSGTAEVLLQVRRAVWEVQPTSDSSRFIVRLGVPATRDIFAFDRRKGAGDSAIAPLIADNDYEEVAPALSPDGRWLAYASNESGRFEVYVRPYPDVNSGRWQVSGDGANEPRWAHSGRELFYRRADGGLVAVTVAPGPTFDAGTQRVLFNAGSYITNRAYADYDVSPDDQRFVFNRTIAPSAGEESNTLIVARNWLGGEK